MPECNREGGESSAPQYQQMKDARTFDGIVSVKISDELSDQSASQS